MLRKMIKLTILKVKVFRIKRESPNMVFGKNFKLDFSTEINVGANKLIIGDNVYLRSQREGYHAGMPFPAAILIDKNGGECSIGDNCRINGAYIHAQEKIHIGRNTLIAAGVNIIDSNGHNIISSDRTKGRDKPKEIFIGDNVWIGLNAIILKGTVIGSNSVVAAGSVVKGNFPDNVLIQGNPAVIVKKLEVKNENCYSS
ncbi:acyltransferase [Pseudoalteromonas sp. OF7H-1]|uniref:acyltransferase n=1 Tax=Pseudoalteromonas sp. OF7H-1 TaxID=2917755 RepID=UPI001EF47CFF|nr:acyltransferase [Pseudoalteromonas sp. OF7H-1]MCG7538911.1 acyltransferase [Pseudoalteromonas sp. OF7H-1]